MSFHYSKYDHCTLFRVDPTHNILLHSKCTLDHLMFWFHIWVDPTNTVLTTMPRYLKKCGSLYILYRNHWDRDWEPQALVSNYEKWRQFHFSVFPTHGWEGVFTSIQCNNIILVGGNFALMSLKNISLKIQRIHTNNAVNISLDVLFNIFLYY